MRRASRRDVGVDQRFALRVINYTDADEFPNRQTARQPRGPRPGQARIRDPASSAHTAADPGFRQRVAHQPRDRRRDGILGPPGPCLSPCALHRSRVARCLRALGAGRTAASHAAGLRRERLSARRRAVSARRVLGCDLEIEWRRASVSRSDLPQPARTRDLVLSRIFDCRRPQDIAQLRGAAGPAPRRSRFVDNRRRMLGIARPARTQASLPAYFRRAAEIAFAARCVRARLWQDSPVSKESPTTMKTIRWGMIGCGDVAEVKSGPGFYKADHSQLVAVMRRNGALAADYARRHGVARWSDDADAIIHAADVDAVYIATLTDS